MKTLLLGLVICGYVIASTWRCTDMVWMRWAPQPMCVDWLHTTLAALGAVLVARGLWLWLEFDLGIEEAIKRVVDRRNYR